MYSELRKILENAKGKPEHIIAIVLDIRGFTPFCQTLDSYDVANFIKRVYIKVIDEYFPSATFCKPTGDGLLVVISCKEDLKKVVVNTIDASLSLITNFKELCKGDPMINFKTPDKIGIGMSRGSACCLSSDGTVIDYSGKVVNLASRLNDIARPSGIIFDSSLGLHFLPKKKRDLFLEEPVYLRGIAETEPVSVYYLRGYTIISDSNKKPLREPHFKRSALMYNSFDELKKMTQDTYPNLMFDLPIKLSESAKVLIEIRYEHPKIKGREQILYVPIGDPSLRYELVGKGSKLLFNVHKLVEKLKSLGAKDNLKVGFRVIYPEV